MVLLTDVSISLTGGVIGTKTFLYSLCEGEEPTRFREFPNPRKSWDDRSQKMSGRFAAGRSNFLPITDGSAGRLNFLSITNGRRGPTQLPLDYWRFCGANTLRKFGGRGARNRDGRVWPRPGHRDRRGDVREPREPKRHTHTHTSRHYSRPASPRSRVIGRSPRATFLSATKRAAPSTAAPGVGGRGRADAYRRVGLSRGVPTGLVVESSGDWYMSERNEARGGSWRRRQNTRPSLGRSRSSRGAMCEPGRLCFYWRPEGLGRRYDDPLSDEFESAYS